MSMKRTVNIPYKIFKESSAYRFLKSIQWLRNSKLAFDKLLSKLLPSKKFLHDDKILQHAFVRAGKILSCSSVIETGTFLGMSTGYMALQFSSTPIFTSEINPESFAKAKKKLGRFPNVHCFHGGSDKFLTYLYDKNLPGERPLFYLDAHWLNEWPLEDEVRIISNRSKSAIMIIDDFKVPGNPNFKYDRYGDKECSIDLIAPHLSKQRTYQILFPNYKAEDIFPDEVNPPELSGYVIIFMDLPDLFNKFMSDVTVSKFFYLHPKK